MDKQILNTVQENEFSNFKLLKIPVISETSISSICSNSKQNYLGGVIDASGSMSTYWDSVVTFWNKLRAGLISDFNGTVAITFDMWFCIVGLNSYNSPNLLD